MEYQDNIRTVSDALGISPETLTHLLIAYPFADRDGTSYSSDPTREQFEKVEYMTSEASPMQSQQARDALTAALLIATDVYIDSVVSDPEKYIPIIRKLIEDIKPEMLPDESLDDFINRDAGEFYVQFNPEKPAPSLGAHRVKDVDYPLDKPNNKIWDLLEENTHGQLELPINVAPRGKNPPVDIMYSINFDDIESDVPIVKRLTQYDKRVMIASFALKKAGNDDQTIDQIYHAMGCKGTPGSDSRLKILKSFIKFRAWITLNNRNEQKDQRTKRYPRFEYEGPLVAYSQINERDVINGQLVNVAFHISDDPKVPAFPMIAFAEQRKQITTIPAEMLATPISQTEANLALEDYLIERIAFAKSGKQPKKIMFSTLYENTGIDTAQKRHRAPEKIEKLLNYYKKIGQIKDFKWTKDSVTLIFEKQKTS